MKTSAGLLLYRLTTGNPELFLVHPGGPFWKNKDVGAWSIPKGEYEASNEKPLNCAIREFKEETGTEITGNFIELLPIKQKGGKLIHAWAVEADIDADAIISNTIQIEWPPKSTIQIEIPEVDKGAWFTINNARNKINPSQILLINQLLEILKT